MGKKSRNKSGFTLMEAIIVVAVLAVITAIAVPGVAALRDRLQMAELDAYARQIYLAAQNELTAMRASGALDGWVHGGSVVTEMPADYEQADAGAADPDAETASWERLVAVPGSALQRALDSVEGATAAGGQAYIELDPAMGHVYAVFFAEDSFTYRTNLPRALEDRKNYEPVTLGYYGGGSLAELPDTLPPIDARPMLTILNGEELAVILSFEAESELYGIAPSSISGFTATLTVTGTKSGATLTRTFTSTDPLNNQELYLILDSLEEGNSFAEVTESRIGSEVDVSAPFILGEDLTASVKIEGKARRMTLSGKLGEAEIQGETSSAPFNSLFASRDETAGNITVSHVRHLNNLRDGVYDLAGTDTITQSRDIDFDFSTWTKFDFTTWTGSEDYLTLSVNPLDYFTPIETDSNLSGFDYNGGGKTIANFPIRGGANTGLFATAENSTFSGVILENSYATGDSNVGALVGEAENCRFTDCGAHLTYRAGMQSWIASHTVEGDDNVGGLIGRLNGGSVEYSYGAVYVEATGDNAGGLIGQAVGATVKNAYASGDITGSNYVGGLIGQGSNVTVDGCYTTSDVTGSRYMGGIMGGGSGGSMQNVTAYGKVPEGGANTGRILGNGAGIAENDTCLFLEKDGYGVNNGIGEYKTYSELLAEDHGPAHPYAEDLQGNPFPFVQIRRGGVSMIHYGDWPLEIDLLAVNLVYYEKYADGKYGYYADAYLRQGLTGQNDATLWNTNSLRDEICVEDGYALLCTTDVYLRRNTPGYSYTLDPFATRYDNTDVVTGEAEIEEMEETQDGSFLLDDNASLRFTNPDNRNVYYTLNGATVYRLPFDLQVTQRTTAVQFWEKLTITYNESSDNGETLGEGKTVTYWYCPDFAKNAVNPEPGNEEYPDEPDEPFVSGDPVYVRSARQLSGLGRSTYYWRRASGDTGNQIHFVQETDIDFFTYAGEGGGDVKKHYCGVEYNLMDTSSGNPYRNKPIGKATKTAAGGTSTDSNFRNNYNGKGNLILDYCQLWGDDSNDANQQFAGLFGEVRSGKIENVVMKASKRAGSAAYIRSEFASSKGDTATVIGVGGLVGNLWVERYSDAGSQVATVENCAIAGYEITYDPRNLGSNTTNRDVGVGGLVGLSVGDVRSSTAVSMTISARKEGNEKLALGGLVGGIRYNSHPLIQNCYAGMNTLIAESTGINTGGILGGDITILMYLLNLGGNRTIPGHVVSCYSFKNLYKESSADDPEVLSKPIAGFTNNDLDTVGNYYLKDDAITDNANTLRGDPKTHEEMSAETPKAQRSIPVDTLLGGAYPYKAVVNHDGEYIHYGDWPDSGARIVYYEKTTNADGVDPQWHTYVPGNDGLDRTNGRKIVEWGYALLDNGQPISITVKGVSDQPDDDKTWTAENAFQNTPEGAPQGLRPLSDELVKQLTETLKGRKVALIGITIGGSMQEDGETEATSVVQYINPLYGAAVYADNNGGKDNAPFEIRTWDQLTNINAFNVGGNYHFFRQTYEVEAEDVTGDAVISGFDWTYDGDGNPITGLSAPLFGTIAEDAAVKNVALTGVNISGSGDAAPLALTNEGTITESFAAGSVNASGNAAGLVLNNSGKISESYANCRVRGANAAGFVWANTGDITTCYSGSGHDGSANSAGFIEATGTAAGFVGSGGSGITNCYSVAAVQGNTAYGFGPDTYTDCYWLWDTKAGFNINATGGGTAVDANAIRRIAGTWTEAPATHADTLTGDYPYPGVGLDHYGDWPQLTPVLTGRIGVARLYQSGSYNNRTHYARGVAIDLKDETPVNIQGQQGSQQSTVLVLFSGISRSEWTIQYRTGYGNWQSVTTNQEYGNPLRNADDYAAYSFDPNSNNFFNNGGTVVLTHNENNVSYTFTFSSGTGTFTYDPDAN